MTQPTKAAQSWSALRDRVFSVNPGLAKLIDAADPGKNLSCTLESYTYGELIDETLPGIVLSGSVESVIETGVRVIGQGLVLPGEQNGLWGCALGLPTASYPAAQIKQYAGARSVFMLPMVGNFACHQDLKSDYGINVAAPKHLSEQASVFQAIAQASNTSWRTEILRFNPAWFKALSSKLPAWQVLRHALERPLWEKAQQYQTQHYWHNALSLIQADRSLKPNPYLIDTLHHLLSVTSQHLPGLAPAGDERLLPLHAIHTAYVDSYGLEEYAPVMMQPTYLNDAPIYYSLQFPTLSRYSPKASAKASLSSQLRELVYLWRIIKPRLLSDEWGGDQGWQKALANVELRFLHTKVDSGSGIEDVMSLVDDDPRFVQSLSGKLAFPASSSFVKGCVQLRRTGKV